MNNKKITVDQYLQLPWPIVQKPQNGKEKRATGFSAELPDLLYIYSQLGKGAGAYTTLLKEYLIIAMKSKSKIPLPAQSEEVLLAGKLLLRLPASLHLGVKNAAKREGTSINQLL